MVEHVSSHEKNKEDVQNRLKMAFSFLDERQRRLIAGTEAEMYGRGGVASIAKATGLSPSTVARGVKEVRNGIRIGRGGRIRAKGGGRKSKKEQYPELVSDIRALWSLQSNDINLKQFGALVRKQGYDVGDATVGSILKELRIRPRKRRFSRKSGGTENAAQKKMHKDQYKYFTQKVRDFLAQELPVITLTTKVRNPHYVASRKTAYKTAGSCTLSELLHAMDNAKVPHIIPTDGSCDLNVHRGWKGLDIQGPAGSFAINALRIWWRNYGKTVYGDAKEILICIQDRGDDGDFWKYELQKWCNATGGLTIHVCQVPQGMNNWNKIEHRFLCLAPQASKGEDDEQLDVVTIINELSLSAPARDCEVSACLDSKSYKNATQKVSKKAAESIHVQPEAVHGEWNYVLPQS